MNDFLSYDDWADDLSLVPEDEQGDWIKDTLKHKKHLHIFGRYFFPNIIRGQNEVPDAHIDLIAEINKPKDSGIIFPRGFAKSTWTKIDTIHDIVYGLEPTILYISDTLTSAGFHFDSIKTELETNEMLALVYGNMVPPESMVGRKWTSTHFETNNKVNCVARGSGKGRGVNIKNRRPTKIICDDIEDDDQVKSPERRQKLNHWLYHVIFPSKDKERGRIKMVGTVLHEQCELLKFYKAHGGIYRKAIENEQSIWPKYWPLEDLEKVKNGYIDENGEYIQGIGTRAFMQEYMNEPTNDELANFNALWIDENYYTVAPKFARPRMVITLDPQSGESARADEYCITVLGFDEHDRHRYVLEQKAGRVSQMDQAKFVILTWQAYPNTFVVGVERVLNQTAVYQYILEWKAGKLKIEGVNDDDRNIPIVGINPGGKDKLARLQLHEAEFERGEIHLRPEMKTLRDQILFLGTNAIDHDDRCDSLIMALDLSNKKKSFSKKTETEYTKRANETVGGNLMKAKF